MVGVTIAFTSVVSHLVLGVSLGLNLLLVCTIVRQARRIKRDHSKSDQIKPDRIQNDRQYFAPPGSLSQAELPMLTRPNSDRALEPSIDALADLKTRFILMVSHEYRTPLTAILTTTELLERYGSKISEQNKERYTHRIKQSVRHMIGLLNDVLLLHQSDAEPLSLLIQPVDVRKVCQDVIGIYNGLAGDRLTIELQSTPLPLHLALDESLLQQIVGNVLSNAVKFSPHPGTVYVELRYQALPHAPSNTQHTSLNRHDGILVIRIEDQGIGIPTAEQSQIFDRFYRGTNIGTIGGTGLGLTLARSGIDRLGGNLKLTSTENQGTIVTIVLPVQEWKISLNQTLNQS